MKARLVTGEDGLTTIAGRRRLGLFCREGLVLWCHSASEEYLVSWSEITHLLVLLATRRR